MHTSSEGWYAALYACSNTFLPSSSSDSYTALMPLLLMMREMGPVMHSTLCLKASSSLMPWRV